MIDYDNEFAAQELALSHLDALEMNLSNERIRLANAKSFDEIALRAVWVSKLKNEVEAEKKFLGIGASGVEISDDDLLAALES